MVQIQEAIEECKQKLIWKMSEEQSIMAPLTILDSFLLVECYIK
jgi:hypothetical protein